MLKFLNMTNELYKKKVQVIILAGNEILLLKLAENRGGFWQNITGGVEDGEEFEVAAVRELEEETGIICTVKYIPLDFEFVDQFGFRVIEKIFYCQIPNKINPIISSEHQDYKWHFINEISEANYKYKTNFYPVEWLINNV